MKVGNLPSGTQSMKEGRVKEGRMMAGRMMEGGTVSVR